MRVRRRRRGGNLPPQFKKKKAPPFGRESNVEGGNARRRADRKANFKRGGNVSLADAEPISNKQVHVGAGSAEKQKYQFGGRVSQHTVRHVTHGDPLRSRTVTTRSTHRDRMAGEFKRGGKTHDDDDDDEEDVKKHQDGGNIGSSRAGRTRMPRPSDEELGRAAGSAEGLKAGGRISTAQRKALPSSDFALPGKGTGAGGKGPGSYPIDTENRARNALSRGAQHASPGQLATIKRKVKAKYPGIAVSADGGTVGDVGDDADDQQQQQQ